MKSPLHLFIALSLLSINCTLMAQNPTFEIEGHRGCRGLLPENTLPAFYKALDLGAYTLELDVVISKDRKVVVSHDTYFNPDISTDPDGIYISKETRNNLYLLDYKEIKKYDVGRRGNKGFPEQEAMKVHKPLLTEVLDKVAKYAKKKDIPRVKWNIEIKSSPNEVGKSQPPVEEFSDLVEKIISAKLDPKDVVIQSFDFNVLTHWHKQIEAGNYPPVTLAVLLGGEANNDIAHVTKKLGFKPDIWSAHYSTMDAQKVKDLHSAGMRVIPWTVNKLEDMQRMKAIACDGLITDYPDRARQL
ncbi:glycerophosphodiester phosphodiesterase [Marinilongibacter aquaticus]|uniref:glycerophosphodiester phosphodiesterase family protein n=1 Tax=Marinilongibacter aquaticus TaxID=2975157 RepID=UPI0021BD6DF0|nr:glycerophosphodiester phosphodiesterase family protein [Marinilongibacter aquaticus]UBM60085.1 glycerophosphodiester phosphodiesterase [Marinilongibacter aquaticus]